MNAPTLFLVTAVFVAAGLLAYDALRANDEAPSTSTIPADDVAAEPDASVLAGLDTRLAALERRLAAQRREIAALRARSGRQGTEAETDPQARAAFLNPPSRAADGSLSIGPETLDALQDYVKEAQRRLRADNVRERAEASIDRLDLPLGTSERAEMLTAVLAYRAKAQTFWVDMNARGITDAQEQRMELQKIKDAFADAVRPYVEGQDLDRVVDGLIGRGSIDPRAPVRRRPWER